MVKFNDRSSEADRRTTLKALVVFALAFAASSGAGLGAQAPSETKTCDAKPDWIAQVRKVDEGWDIGFVGKTRKLGSEAPMLASTPGFTGVTVTEYATRQKYFKWTDVVVYPCDHTVSLRTKRLLIKHIYAYSKNRKAFAYTIAGDCGSLEKGVWVGALCDTSALLMDTTGSGKFDFLRLGVQQPDNVPGWVGK